MSEKKIDFDTLEIDIKKLPLKVSGSVKKKKKCRIQLKKVLNSNFAKENLKTPIRGGILEEKFVQAAPKVWAV